MSKNKIANQSSDRVFYFLNDCSLLLALLIVAYPIIYIVSSSFSSPMAVSTGKVVFLPVDFTLRGYEAVLKHKVIATGYMNSIFYTVVGTLINIVMTMLAGFSLSRKELPFRRFFIALFTFTMLFGGGMIPTYMLNINLGLRDTRLVMFIPGAISIFNLIIAKNFLENNIPEELFEASQLDGCSYYRYLLSVVIPLSKSILAVLALYYAVIHWNSYFDAFLYLSDRNKMPLQLVLREILILNAISTDSIVTDVKELLAKQGMSDLLKYSVIIVSSAPLIIIYPFISKYFVKGALTGSVKG